MKNLLLTVAVATGLALPATAQITGSSNKNAPKCASSIEFSNGAKIELSYTSLNFADGKFVEQMENERFRNYVNENAKENPVGSLMLSSATNFGGKDLASGSYGVHFMITEDAKWKLVLSNGGELTEWVLDLEDDGSKKGRLAITVEANDTTSANINLCFGAMHTSVAAKPAMEKKAVDAGHDK